MIVKVQPGQLMKDQDATFLFDCQTVEITTSLHESWDEVHKHLERSGGYSIRGPKHEKSREGREPSIRLVLDSLTAGQFKSICIIGVAVIFVMNDQGKTVDKFYN